MDCHMYELLGNIPTIQIYDCLNLVMLLLRESPTVADAFSFLKTLYAGG